MVGPASARELTVTIQLRPVHSFSRADSVLTMPGSARVGQLDLEPALGIADEADIGFEGVAHGQIALLGGERHQRRIILRHGRTASAAWASARGAICGTAVRVAI